MGKAKEIVLKVIPASIANPFIRAHHYSGGVVTNSCLHFGVFLDGQLHGVMSYGPSMNKQKMIGLVEGTGWNEFLELNRMAFDSVLPRNSESRALSISLRLIRKYAPQVKWVLSFADACSCGDGTIYRAANFVLTGMKRNEALCILPDAGNPDGGTRMHKMVLSANPTTPRPGTGRQVLLRRHRRALRMEEVSAKDRREAAGRLAASIYLLHRPQLPAAADRAGNSLFPHRRTGRRNVQRRKSHAGCKAQWKTRARIG